MAQTYTKFIYHAVFSTKNRIPSIKESMQARVYDYLGGILRRMDAQALAINGIEDHVHLLFLATPDVAFSDIMRVLKANSSRWINLTWRTSRRFAWQNGYGAFTVSASRVDAVRGYIERQKEHHKKRSSGDEFRWLLELHGIDPQFVGDDDKVIGSDSVQESVAPYGGSFDF